MEPVKKDNQSRRRRFFAPNRQVGFDAIIEISPEIAEFMNLQALDHNDVASVSFLIIFMTLYCRLGGLTDRQYIKLNPMLQTLFCDALVAEQLNPDAIRYTDLPKLLRHHHAYGNHVLKEVRRQRRIARGTIPPPDNFERLEQTIKRIYITLRNAEKTRDQEHYEKTIQDMRVAWLCLGLPGWQVEEVHIEGDEESEPQVLLRLKIYGGDEDPECCICLDAAKDRVFLPCRHMCCCEGCAASVQDTKQPCPICRTPIAEIVLFDAELHEINHTR